MTDKPGATGASIRKDEGGFPTTSPPVASDRRCFRCGSADLKPNRKDELVCVKCGREQTKEKAS